MPIYEYECQSCTEVIEIWQSLSEAPVESCPSCEGTLKKIISMSSFQLKGGGWFADGYSNSPASKSDSKKAPSPSCPKAKNGCGTC
ncbi:MAG: zinc ribbon domain-containing protein [Thermodesulfovibrionia bacterium]|nr:zinc ribbon domain-containing protein [Thermodesulfovibrionia bacterium]